MPPFDQNDPSRKDTQTLDDANERLRHPVIESASASTAPQEGSSNFAYVLTGTVLLIVSLLLAALILLVFGIVGTGLSIQREYGDGALEYLESWDEPDYHDPEFQDELDRLEDEFMDGFMGGTEYEA